MSNSSLVNVKMLTKNYGYPDGKTGRNGTKIDKIFVHHMAGILTVEQCGNVFKNRPASAHYGIDSKGRVGLYVDEKNAAWHCGNKAYNLRSIGIELSNDGGASTGWHVSDKAIAKCIDLIVDICNRHNIKEINYTGDLKGNLCMHRWVATTSCPASYLASKFKYIAEQVNKKITANKEIPATGEKWKIIRDKGLYMYDKPSKKGNKLMRLAYGTVFTVHDTKIGTTSCFAKIKKDNKYGWVLIYDKNDIYCIEKSKETIEDKIISACKDQAEWMKNFKYEWEQKPTIPKSKKKGTCVTYTACVLQRIGYLKSGQYIWHNGRGYGDGKVVGTNDKMTTTYMNNKTFTACKEKLRKGDVILCDDNKSGKKGNGGHIMIFSGKWATNGDCYVYDQNSATYAKKGKSLLRNYDKSHKILAIVRMKNK